MNQRCQKGEFGNLRWAVATEMVLPPDHVSNAARPHLRSHFPFSRLSFLVRTVGPFSSPSPPWAPLGSRLHSPWSNLRASFEAGLRTNVAIRLVRGMAWFLTTPEPSPPATKPSLHWPWPLLRPPSTVSQFPFSFPRPPPPATCPSPPCSRMCSAPDLFLSAVPEDSPHPPRLGYPF